METRTKHKCEENLMLCENESECFQACSVCGTTFPAPFDEAIKRFPSFLAPGYDPLKHTTTESLIEMVRDELSFYDDREDSDIKTKTQRHQAEMFIEQVGG